MLKTQDLLICEKNSFNNLDLYLFSSLFYTLFSKKLCLADSNSPAKGRWGISNFIDSCLVIQRKEQVQLEIEDLNNFTLYLLSQLVINIFGISWFDHCHSHPLDYNFYKGSMPGLLSLTWMGMHSILSKGRNGFVLRAQIIAVSLCCLLTPFTLFS